MPCDCNNLPTMCQSGAQLMYLVSITDAELNLVLLVDRLMIAVEPYNYDPGSALMSHRSCRFGAIGFFDLVNA